MNATTDWNDAGFLREELADLYARGFLSHPESKRARRVINRLARLLGWTREAVIAQAIEDAEQMGMMEWNPKPTGAP